MLFLSVSVNIVPCLDIKEGVFASSFCCLYINKRQYIIMLI